ncbi:hypothetical protein H7I77_13255 [Mycolicibacterium novocastrense]|uniref:Ribonuclease D n=1 Tax=Mycolicibacterium novocastrense TaxID=59813 RepID=A0AAW5SLI3_MYCNV|nr:hypothetical protein [Mycolicibacterium novocastrense]MCV7024306.1 hypothetical protein [Mycolicibacterium novocastrense]GAT06875.1 ribonuclease D [Mycolicibacterium novocastrense]
MRGVVARHLSPRRDDLRRCRFGHVTSLRAAAFAGVLALIGWLIGVVDLDLFSPDSAADLETDLYVAALLVAAYGAFLRCNAAGQASNPPPPPCRQSPR